jgi:FkbM family methyltransferase
VLGDRSPKVIFDCGANVGFVTHRFLNLFPSATVHAFEPNPRVFSTLVQAYAEVARVKPHPLAISSHCGTATFEQNENSGTSSFFSPTTYNRRFYARQSCPLEVTVTTIDEFSKQHLIDHIEILKLDIEGAEKDAISGAESMLSQHRIDIVYTEVAIVPLYQGQPLLEDLIAAMRRHGYSLYNLYGFNESIARQAVLGNATFISPRMRREAETRWGIENCGWSPP